MKKIWHMIAHALLSLLDIIVTALTTIGIPIPWEYSERHQRRMKERINGKK